MCSRHGDPALLAPAGRHVPSDPLHHNGDLSSGAQGILQLMVGDARLQNAVRPPSGSATWTVYPLEQR